MFLCLGKVWWKFELQIELNYSKPGVNLLISFKIRSRILVNLIKLSLLIIFCLYNNINAQETKDISLKDYGTSKDYPFGRINPKAPKELLQMSFMIGNFDRSARSLKNDGTWTIWVKGEWNAKYFMNGFAIIDESFNYRNGATTSNIRFYDVKDKIWKVTWFKEPGYSTTYAEGVKEGDDLVIIDISDGNKYIFYDIQKDSYKWKQIALRNNKMTLITEYILTRKK